MSQKAEIAQTLTSGWMGKQHVVNLHIEILSSQKKKTGSINGMQQSTEHSTHWRKLVMKEPSMLHSCGRPVCRDRTWMDESWPRTEGGVEILGSTMTKDQGFIGGRDEHGPKLTVVGGL